VQERELPFSERHAVNTLDKGLQPYLLT